MISNIKWILRMLFYEIPKDIWDGGAWDKEDYIETYRIDLYQLHTEYKFYSKLDHIIGLITLNILSLFSWAIGISRILFILGVLKHCIKDMRRKRNESL